MNTLPLDAANELDGGSLPTIGAERTRGKVRVSVYARAKLPTRHGEFTMLVFRSNVDDKEHVALVRGDVRGAGQVPARVHSECLTGDVLASLRCDCRDQLELALYDLGRSERGILLYMRQEGRGIGLGNKIRAYALQEGGMDTYEANRHLGFDDDLRTYDVAALMLELLGVESIELGTNNPRKIFGLRGHGIDVSGRQPVVARANPHNARYLAAKKNSGHML
jgi:GTP cyclohydrolase II